MRDLVCHQQVGIVFDKKEAKLWDPDLFVEKRAGREFFTPDEIFLLADDAMYLSHVCKMEFTRETWGLSADEIEFLEQNFHLHLISSMSRRKYLELGLGGLAPLKS